MTWTNILALYAMELITTVKSFMTQGPKGVHDVGYYPELPV